MPQHPRGQHFSTLRAASRHPKGEALAPLSDLAAPPCVGKERLPVGYCTKNVISAARHQQLPGVQGESAVKSGSRTTDGGGCPSKLNRHAPGRRPKKAYASAVGFASMVPLFHPFAKVCVNIFLVRADDPAVHEIDAVEFKRLFGVP